MQYYSTNHRSPKASFREVMAKSEAADGGLYMPERLPVLPKAFFNNISAMSLKDIAFVISSMFTDEDFSPAVLKGICNEVFSAPMPIYEIEPDIYVMEMFHGPTKTVKDLGAGFLTRMMKELYVNDSVPHSVMIATTGYSGAAIAKGFHDVGGTEVFVLYPKGTSKSHLEVINSMGDNIHAIEVRGTIDNCKDMIARAFEDKEFEGKLTLTSANSTNFGYLLPYISIYFYAYSQLLKKAKNKSEIYMSIPTGNCGNLLAAYMAKKMGMPDTKLIAACNVNAGFDHFLSKGEKSQKQVSKRSFAYGIDSVQPGNLPRFDDFCHGDVEQLRRDIVSDICTDEEIADTINSVYEKHGYLLDPHSAVAYKCLKDMKPEGVAGIMFATAHPSRSMDVMTQVDRGKLRLPYTIDKSYCCRPEALIPPSYTALKKFLNFFNSTNTMQYRG